MNIKITGRHLTVTKSMREYAEKKILKLENYFHQLINAHVILFVEKLDHVAEVIVNGDGIRFHALVKSGDMYSAIDLLYDKIDRQIVKYKEKISGHKSSHAATAPTFEVVSDDGISIILNQVDSKPFDPLDAFLEMNVDKKDFILFKQGIADIETDTDYLNKNYAVIYKSDKGHKMIEIPFDMIKEHRFEPSSFVKYDLLVKSDSPSNPKIELKKAENQEILCMAIDEAVDHMKNTERKFVPFFNVDSNHFNIVYKNGKALEVMVPTF